MHIGQIKPLNLSFQHVNDVFYKRRDGHLFQRTFGQVEVEHSDTLVDIEYFDGNIPQDINPLTFEVLTGWFAKDKNFVYYYRPMSGGMHISKMANADVQTFKVLTGDYRIAIDKNHVFEENKMLDGFNSLNLVVKRNKKGYIIELSDGAIIYKIDGVEE